jgi:hypothetical protein
MAITIDGTNGLSSDNAALKLDGTTLVVDEANNRVGVGTASPAVAMDVVGQVRASTGILFGSDTAAANALDDYEEGTWTVTATASTSGTITLSPDTGTYTKIGNRVWVSCRVDVSSVASPVGNLRISLPFTSVNPSPLQAGRSVPSIFIYDSVSTNMSSFIGVISQGQTYLTILIGNSSIGSAAAGQMKAGTEIHFAGQYIVA